MYFKSISISLSGKHLRKRKGMLNLICVTALPLSNLLCDLGPVTSLSLGFHIYDLGTEILSRHVLERLPGCGRSLSLILRHLPARREWCCWYAHACWYDLGLGFDQELGSDLAFTLQGSALSHLRVRTSWRKCVKSTSTKSTTKW